jgi:hypothetical protein
MNKTIRRSIAIAAGMSSVWALGSAVASADELPAHSVSVPDRPAGAVADVPVTAAALGTVAQVGAVAGAADTATGHVARTAHTVAGATARTAHPAEAAPPVARTTAAPAAQASGLPGASELTGTVNQAVSTVTHLQPVADAESGLTDVAVAVHENLPDPAAPGSLSYTALRAAGDALYIGEGIDGDLSDGRLPDNVPQDTARLVQDTVDDLGGQSLAGR